MTAKLEEAVKNLSVDARKVLLYDFVASTRGFMTDTIVMQYVVKRFTEDVIADTGKYADGISSIIDIVATNITNSNMDSGSEHEEFEAFWEAEVDCLEETFEDMAEVTRRNLGE